MSSFNNNSSGMDNLLLQTLMGRLHLRSPINNPLIAQSLEDFLFNADNFDDEEEEEDDEGYDDGNKSDLSKEESKLERAIIKVIHTGNTDSLKPNSGQAVSVRDHHICVGFHEEKGSEYRVWEWHGHIMMFDEEHGYSPEYIYGNYFQRLGNKARGGGDGGSGGLEVVEEEKEEEEEEEEDKVGNLGLRELIDSKDSNEGRILHRNMNAGSPRIRSSKDHVWFGVEKPTLVSSE
ncbi:hypothetical protein Lal_00023386 [Lupinus albus]|nr:hypothetical protein Lal_00023386 [Lupinus albus]